jgi:nitronate monooxygenase
MNNGNTKQFSTDFSRQFSLSFPIIMAPMFLVSNHAMIVSAMRSGIMGVFPSLNYRDITEMEKAIASLTEIRILEQHKGNFGVNLIVQQTNPYFKKHLEVCEKHKVPFYITSLGNPRPVIDSARKTGSKVYSDVTNLMHAEKCAKEGCDGFIAVGQGAGGHAGPNPLSILIPMLKKEFPQMPVIAAGGMSTGAGLLSTAALGASGFSIGTRYIASTEATVSNEYKSAIVNAGMDDIVMTERLSGTPCNIINTPYAKKVGYKQNFFEKFLSNNKRTKKLFKTWVQYSGMKKLYASVVPGSYDNLWTAGKSAALVNEILPCDTITQQLQDEFFEAFEALNAKIESR